MVVWTRNCQNNWFTSACKVLITSFNFIDFYFSDFYLVFVCVFQKELLLVPSLRWQGPCCVWASSSRANTAGSCLGDPVTPGPPLLWLCHLTVWIREQRGDSGSMEIRQHRTLAEHSLITRKKLKEIQSCVHLCCGFVQ